MTTWEIRLPYRTPPLSLNDRTHWRAKAATTADVRRTTRHLVVEALIANRVDLPLERAAITLTYYPRDNRRRDRTNLVATYKACVDGCVDAGVIVDDTPEYLDELMPIIAAPDGAPRLVLSIRAVTP